jgi:uncharacterized protein YndB with AHSA1/START domain
MTARSSVDHHTFTITFERELQASPEDVFDAWTEPDQMSGWWDPSGAHLVKCTIDLRVGGAFEFVNAGGSPPFAGLYREIDRPSRLVFEALGALGSVELTRSEGKTRMRVTIRCSSAEHLEHFVRFGIHRDTDRTLDRLVACFEARGSHPGTTS